MCHKTHFPSSRPWLATFCGESEVNCPSGNSKGVFLQKEIPKKLQLLPGQMMRLEEVLALEKGRNPQLTRPPLPPRSNKLMPKTPTMPEWVPLPVFTLHVHQQCSHVLPLSSTPAAVSWTWAERRPRRCSRGTRRMGASSCARPPFPRTTHWPSDKRPPGLILCPHKTSSKYKHSSLYLDYTTCTQKNFID